MKKIFLIVALFFQFNIVAGQTSLDWSPWITSDNYPGIKYKIVNWGKVSGEYSDYYWGLMFQNTYSEPISFSYHLSVGGENPPTQYNYITTYKIEPNGVYSNDGTKATAILFKSNSTNYVVYLKDLEIDNDKNNSINQTNNSNSSSNKIDEQIKTLTSRRSELCIQVAKIDQNTYNNICDSWQGRNQTPTKEQTLTYLKEDIRKLEMRVNSTNSNTQQNDLTEYNRSKADLERQMAEKNAEIQRENQRIAQENARKAEEERKRKIQLQQEYNNSLNQAQQNISNKDYNAAIQSYGEAGKNATTNGEKNVAVAGVVLSGVGGMFDAIAKEKAEKKERERIQQEQKERELQQASDIMNENWISAQDLAKQDDYTEAINIMLPYGNANKLNGMALNTIGFWYYNLSDYENAKIWYEKGLNKDNNSCAMHNLGTLYENGQGVAVNLEKALKFYQQSCEKKDDTGCKQYEKLKSVVDVGSDKAKTTIANFKLKYYVDYLVSQCEKSGFKFDNILGYCTEELSKQLTVVFIKNEKKLYVDFIIEYSKAYSSLQREIKYYVDSELKNDFSKLQLSSIIGNEKIDNIHTGGSFELSKTAPSPISQNTYKGSKYRGFEKETSISNENTIDAYLNNANISCDLNEKNAWLIKAAEAGDVDSYKAIFYNQINNKKTNHGFTGECLLKYIQASTNNMNSEKLQELEQLAKEAFEADKSYEKAEEKNRRFQEHIENYILCIKAVADLGGVNAIKNLAKLYENGIEGIKNYEQAVFYYSKLTHDAEAMCIISNLYKKGGNKTSNIFEKNNKLSKEWKKKSVNAGGVCE